MTTVTAPRNGIPIGVAEINGQRVTVDIHPEYLRFFSSLMVRIGGVNGLGITDVDAGSYAAMQPAWLEQAMADVIQASGAGGDVASETMQVDPAFQTDIYPTQ